MKRSKFQYKIVNDPNDKSTPSYDSQWIKLKANDSLTLFPGKYIVDVSIEQPNRSYKCVKPLKIQINDDETFNFFSNFRLYDHLAPAHLSVKISGNNKDAIIYQEYNGKLYEVSKLNEEFLLKIPGQKYDDDKFSSYKNKPIYEISDNGAKLIVRSKYYKDISIEIPRYTLDGQNPFIEEVEFVSDLSVSINRPKLKGASYPTDYLRYLNSQTQTIKVDNGPSIKVRSWPVTIPVEPDSKQIQFITTGEFINTTQTKAIRPKSSNSLVLDPLEEKKALVKLQLTGSEIPKNIFLSVNGKTPRKFNPQLKSDINYSVSPFSKETLVFSAEGYRSFKLELQNLVPGKTLSKFVNFVKIPEAVKSRPSALVS